MSEFPILFGASCFDLAISAFGLPTILLHQIRSKSRFIDFFIHAGGMDFGDKVFERGALTYTRADVHTRFEGLGISWTAPFSWLTRRQDPRMLIKENPGARPGILVNYVSSSLTIYFAS